MLLFHLKFLLKLLDQRRLFLQFLFSDLHFFADKHFVNLGLEQYFESDGLCVVEWAEKGLAVFPVEHLLINMEYLTETNRKIIIQAETEDYNKLLEELKGKLTDWN